MSARRPKFRSQWEALVLGYWYHSNIDSVNPRPGFFLLLRGPHHGLLFSCCLPPALISSFVLASVIPASYFERSSMWSGKFFRLDLSPLSLCLASYSSPLNCLGEDSFRNLCLGQSHPLRCIESFASSVCVSFDEGCVSSCHFCVEFAEGILFVSGLSNSGKSVFDSLSGSALQARIVLELVRHSSMNVDETSSPVWLFSKPGGWRIGSNGICLLFSLSSFRSVGLVVGFVFLEYGMVIVRPGSHCHLASTLPYALCFAFRSIDLAIGCWPFWDPMRVFGFLPIVDLGAGKEWLFHGSVFELYGARCYLCFRCCDTPIGLFLFWSRSNVSLEVGCQLCSS